MYMGGNKRKNTGRPAGRIAVALSCVLVIAVSVGATLAFSGKWDIQGQKGDGKAAASVKGTNGTGSKTAGADISSGTTGADTSGAGAAGSANASKEFTFIGNWYMNTRVKFILDGIWHRMGNMDEILDTVGKIRHTSELSWFREWNKTAAGVEASGDGSLAKGHGISAGEDYLRASNYYLAAEVFLHTNPDDPRILETFKKGEECFMKGEKLLSQPVIQVDIPFEGTTLRGYFFKTAGPNGRAPTLLVHQGFDAPIETSKYIAEEAVRRGYNCLMFEGPGQGLTIREKKLPFRPDWENVVSAVVDYACAQTAVDPGRIVLMGISMGGGFAARAAAYEHRIRICILDPGYVNLYSMVRDMFGTKLTNLYEQDPSEFDKEFLNLTKYDVGIRWGVHHGMWVFGSDTPSGFLTQLKKYDYTKDIGLIKCRTLVMDGAAESWGKGQAKALYDMLKCPKDYMLFTKDDHAAAHCQTGGPAIQTRRMFDWLDEHIDK